MIEDVFFAWEGAHHPEGPWRHLRVLEVRGTEAMSAPYSFEIELVRLEDAPDVGVEELVGARAALRIATKVDPPWRVIHGVIASAEELGEIERGARYRVELAPPLVRAGMMKKSLIHLEKTLRQIVEATLTRASWGAGLALKDPAAPPGEADDGDMSRFTPARASLAWRCLDTSRLDDLAARPYCVQYNESDLAFASRLLEEEGIAYHYEHTRDECVLVLSDWDGGRRRLGLPLGPGFLGHAVESVRVGGRLRPRSASLDDHDWRKPRLDLLAQSPSGVTDFQTHEHPGRYEDAREQGERLAEKREQRLDTERTWAAADARSRLVSAGSIFTLEHPNGRWSGEYLITAARTTLRQRGSFSTKGEEDPFLAQISALRCGAPGKRGESRFRPERVTPRPRIQGSQTAVVTAEPSAADAEINVGGPEDIGCVRARFHWDRDVGRHAIEPTSCWIRVSQLFAGASHGAIWSPRVGEEVIVDFLEGDPDRPIITGRVYNGVNRPAESPAARPTWSAIKSYTSPRNDNYNMIGFEDLQGQEQIVVHAARDLDETVLAAHNTGVGGDQTYKIGGQQCVTIGGQQYVTVARDRSINVLGAERYNVAVDRKTSICGDDALNVDGTRGVWVNTGDDLLQVKGSHKSKAGVSHVFKSPSFTVEAGSAKLTMMDGNVVLDSGAGAVLALSGDLIVIQASRVVLQGGATVEVKAPKVVTDGGGGKISCEGKVEVSGSVIKLND